MISKLVFAFLLLPGFAYAAEPSPTAQREIAHLLQYLGNSGCQFNRNDRWYSSAEAVAHLDKKYQYLLKKDLVASAEDFIARAASESSISGKPYQVKCGTNGSEPSSMWLKSELAKYRKGRQ